MLKVCENINKYKNKLIFSLVLFVFFAILISPQNAWAWASDHECPTMDELQKRYQGSCFACQIVKVLLSSFMNAAANVYDVSKAAGVQVLIIGSMLWIAFWALKKMSSLTNIEPMTMMQELLIFIGKIIVAFTFITISVEHPSELQSHSDISYAVFCL